MGKAIAQNADTILKTGAVQSNFTRATVTVTRARVLRTMIQFEDRVRNGSDHYINSGNVLLSSLGGGPKSNSTLTAEMRPPRTDELRAAGQHLYIIHLLETYKPLGALGYVDADTEILSQHDDFDIFVVASGSGATHAELLAGLRGASSRAAVIGSYVRRAACLQSPRIERVLKRLDRLYAPEGQVRANDIRVWDGAFALGYGRIGEKTLAAIKLMASMQGLFLDPF